MTPPLLPQVVLGGAPKCGTTSIFRWLAMHPEIAGSEPKETFFLVDEESPFRLGRPTVHDRGLDGYRDFWPKSAASRLRLEGTTHYLFQRTAREVLASLESEPVLIFLLREPAERVLSSFRYTREMLARVDRSLDFASYVETVLEDPSRLARWVDDPRSLYSLQREVEFSRYAEHLERWLEVLPVERVKVYLLEVARSDRRGFMRRLAAELGIAPDFYDTARLRRENVTARLRSPRLQALVRRLTERVPRGPLTRRLYRGYLSLQRLAEKPMNEADAEALARLRSFFVEPNRRLTELLGLDLTRWE